MQQELKYAHDWTINGHATVLAIVTKTWGSAPRPVGSLMVIHEDGHFEGSVSGGCVEGSVIAEASVLMGKSLFKTLNFEVATKDAWQIGLACGGHIQIQLHPLATKDIEGLANTLTAFEEKRYGSFILNKNGCASVFRAGTSEDRNLPSVTETEQNLHLAIRPKPAMFIVGAVHIAQHLTPMALACDYDVTVIDPRGIFVAERSFEGANIIHDWPDEYFNTNPPDACSALITLTHDPKIDDAALIPGLNSDAFYIGSLGSKKTHASRTERLLKQGINAEQLARINGPIGLNIGSKSPAEIAISIMAQVTAALRGVHEI